MQADVVFSITRAQKLSNTQCQIIFIKICLSGNKNFLIYMFISFLNAITKNFLLSNVQQHNSRFGEIINGAYEDSSKLSHVVLNFWDDVMF